jgi:hypothetical protein
VATKHYHVIAGLQGGYIPNSNDQYPTKRDALAGAMWHVDQYRESGEKVRGSKRAGYWIARESESLPGTFWDYVEVTGPCFDDCEDWD